ncbi:UvrD-helicase domain-containing protein [Haploplasma axanthum]|uniref:DNA 3'-5' helicase n=2 Tax=Haploplasma axanthum TaxID=29552 RepID=A0A449BDS1_HAPAX|nr:UvrD-helicase domain-containing protein [Haploplasma axanthum]VEU80601.1 ATP-dependent DNA helicase UvrD/PcrA [Haploplasma axanthum]
MTKEKVISEYGLNDAQALVVIDKSKELIVPAGAGSGKTKTLVTKVVHLLKTGADLDKFLVLTFTKKAANEMKERIKHELKKANLDALANKIDSSNISTFDAYAYNFVKQNASLIGLDSNIELLDQAVFFSLKKQIMSEIIMDIYLNNNSKIYEFLEMFTDKTSDESIVNDLISVYEKLIEKKNINEYSTTELIKKRVLFDSAELRETLEDISYEFCLLNDEYLENLYEVMDYLDSKTDNKIDFIGKRLKWTEIDSYSRKKIEKILKTYKDILKTNLDREDIDEVYRLQEYYLESVLDILNAYDEKILRFKEATNKYEFNDIANFLNKILKENKDILNRTKNRFKYVFVDEYQDTSSVQSEFLEMLIENNNDINVLYVGDIKQSIYKFRNAKPETFIEKLDTVNVISLSTNYRSSKRIIDFVNDIFLKILNNKEKYDIDYSDNHYMQSGSKLFSEDDSSADIFIEEIYTEDPAKSKYDAVEEAFVVGLKIKGLLETKKVSAYKDVAILSRNTTSFKIFKDVFKYLNIPLQVQVDQQIKSSYLLKLMANILMLSLDIAVNNNDNFKRKRFNYFSVARSELFQKSDYELFKALIDSNTLVGNNRKLDIDKEILNKCYKVYEAIMSKTNYEIIDIMVKEFQIFEKIIYATNKSDKEYQIEYLYNIASTLSDLNIMGKRFVEYIYELAYDDNVTLKLSVLQDEEENSVRLTNIHQSKGLEYNTLFVCGLNKKFGGSQMKKLKYGNDSKLIMQMKFEDNEKAHVYGEINSLIKQKGLNEEKASALKEELRLLYVALTRPKKALYLVMTPKDDYTNLDSFTDYLYENDITDIVKSKNVTRYQTYLKDPNYYKDLKDSNLYYPNIIDSLKEKSFDFSNEYEEEMKASIEINQLIDETLKNNLSKGTLLHEIFEYNDFNDLRVKNFYKMNFDGRDLKDAIDIYKELPFSYEEKEIIVNGIIDMVATYDNEVHIIDYKTSNIDPSKYMNQLESYRKYLKMIYPNKVIKTFLYSIAHNKLELVLPK